MQISRICKAEIWRKIPNEVTKTQTNQVKGKYICLFIYLCLQDNEKSAKFIVTAIKIDLILFE